jgi:hypothetical protein
VTELLSPLEAHRSWLDPGPRPGFDRLRAHYRAHAPAPAPSSEARLRSAARRRVLRTRDPLAPDPARREAPRGPMVGIPETNRRT